MANIKNVLTGFEATVFMNLKARGPKDPDFDVNRIGLKCENISFTTSRTIPSFPIPMAGSITGESLTMAMDLGMAQKTINVSGIITEQTIAKRFPGKAFATGANFPTPYSAGNKKGKVVRVKMTAFEICQLIHSYVDSSLFQDHQNLNEIIVLIPSRVDKDYQYHLGLDSGTCSITGNTNKTECEAAGGGTGVWTQDYDTPNAENLDNEELPVIPFGYYVRDTGADHKLDAQGAYAIGDRTSSFPQIANVGICHISDKAREEFDTEEKCLENGGAWTAGNDIRGIKGFIRNFNSTFVGGQPWVDFTLDFEVAQIGV